MEVVVRSEAGEAEMRLLGDRSHHTLGELAERVIGSTRSLTRIGVDDQVHSPDVTLDDAGVRRGSVIDFAPPADEALGSTAGRLVQIAGHGAGAMVDLQDGTYRLGPTVRHDALHLQPGPVRDAAVLLRVQGQLVEVEPVDGTVALLTGRPLTARRAWTNGDLTVADRVFVRSRHRNVPDRANRTDRRHLMPIPVGHALDRSRHATDAQSSQPDDERSIVTVDPVGGVGIVAEHDDAIAILRGIVLELADRSWPHGTALGIRTARPTRWEWTKWLPSVDTPRVEPGATTSRTRPSRHVIVVDDGTADEDDRHRHADYVVVIAAASTQDRLAPGLATVVHAVGGDHYEPPSAVSITAIADGSVVVHPRVAPYAIPEQVAARRARRMTDAATTESATTGEPVAAADGGLRLIPWTIARAPTAWERLLERRSRPTFSAHADGSDRDWSQRPAQAPSTEAVISDDAPPDHYERLMRAALIDDQRILVPLGLWSERDDVAVVPLHAGRRLAVIGPRRSGRSELLATMADGVRRTDGNVDVFVVAPRRGALADVGATLRFDVARGPADVADWCNRIERSARPLVFIDGADRVGGPSFSRLVGDSFDRAAVVLTFDDEPAADHWSAPWADGRMTIRLDDPGRSALFDARHRARRFEIVRRPTPPDQPVAPSGHRANDEPTPVEGPEQRSEDPS